MASNRYKKKRSFDTTVAMKSQRQDEESTTTNLLVSNLLPKLRPFQREAYEFATEGKISKRLQKPPIPAPTPSSSSKRASREKSSPAEHQSSFSYDPSYLGKGRILLADEMGLGKTVTSLAIMAHYKEEWPLLVLCPASLRHTWPAEIEKFLPTIPPSSICVLNGFNDIDFVNRIKKGNVQVVVATYSLLQHRSAVAQVLMSPKEDIHFKCVIADESHNLKTWNSQRCKIAMPILKSSKRLVLLSGTPALARPVELYSQVHALAPNLFGNYTNYTKRYCDPKFKFGRRDVTGLSHAKELHANLKQIMVRRLKCDVLQELPAKQRMVVPIVKITDKTLMKENQQLIQDLKDTRKSISNMVDQGGGGAGADFEAKSLFMQAYQASGIIKAQAVAEYLVDWIAGSGTQKVLVFAHHKAVMDTLELAISKQLKGVGHIRIDGSVAANDRAKLVRKFQTSAQVRIGLLSMTAAGVGLTLTAASTVMFAELHFTPGVLAQAEDRAHRIGQLNAVNIMYFVCKDSSFSVDTQIWNMLGRKIGTLEQVIDGGSGKERAALAAKEMNGDEANANIPRQSVQEELTSFFAETAAAGITSGKNKQPEVAVKGSILSFFKNKDSASNTITSTQSNNIRVGNSSIKAANANINLCKRQGNPSETTRPQSDDDEMLEWACQTCTFINSKKKKSYLTCEMCQSMYIAEDFVNDPTTTTIRAGIESAPLVTPVQRSVPPKASYESPSLTVRTPSSVLSTKQTPSPADAIVIDEESSPFPVAAGSKRRWTKTSITTRTSLSPSKKSSLADTIVVIDDDNDNKLSPATQANSSNKRKRSQANRNSSAVIDLNVEKENKRAHTSPNASKTIHKEVLAFSVSKNSGRITLHYKESSSSSFVNFDVHEILTEETTNALEETQTKRANVAPTSISISFQQDAIRKVVKQLDTRHIKSKTERKQSCIEIISFVSSYLSLRGIERKAIQNSGEPFSSKGLAQAAAKIMTAQALQKMTSLHHPSGTGAIGTTERYSGGAKERAGERLKEGNATPQDMAVLNGTHCAWCAGPLSEASLNTKSAVYCSQDCAETGRIRRGGMFTSSMIRSQAFALEGGVCQLCHVDAHALYLRVKALAPAQRLSVLCNANWKLPKTHDAMERLLQDPKEGSFWQVDHIQAVAEGGGSCGMDNLRTLCVPCHTVETQKLRGRLKLTGPPNRVDEGSGGTKTKQLDIRTIFAGSSK